MLLYKMDNKNLKKIKIKLVNYFSKAASNRLSKSFSILFIY